MRLTESGAVLLRHARALLEGSAAAKRELVRSSRGEVGRIAVAFAPTVGGLLPAAFRAFRQRFPDVAVELHEIPSPEAQAELLLRDAIQVGVGQRATDEGRRLRAERVLSERFTSVALPARHRLVARNARPIKLSQLWGERIITPPASSAYVAQLAAVAQTAGASPQLVTAADPTTRLVLVAAGVGVTLLLPSAPRLQHPDIAYRRLVGAPMSVDVYITVRSDEARPQVRAFLGAVRAVGRSNDARTAARPSISISRATLEEG